MPGLTSGAVRVRLVVSGRVQGVFFRDGCRAEAEAAGVAGWVRNRDDGRVEAELEGSPNAVERVVDWCREGPRRAVVTGLERSDIPALGAAGFEVR